MHSQVNKIAKLNIVIALVLIVVFSVFANYAFAATETIQPQDDQYLELRAVTVDAVAGQNQQVIFELWSHNLDFKGFNVTFEYDKTRFQPSSLFDNVITDDETDFFAFESEFNGKLDLFSMPDSRGNVLDLTVSLNTPISSGTEHIVSDGNGGYKVTSDDVLIGKMSFQMPSNTAFSIDGFELVTNAYTPQTGIKIDKSLTENYQAQSTFRFTDETASKNAYLTNLIVSSGEIDLDDPTNSTYKEYALTPTFDKDEGNYEITLLEYVDKVDIKATLEDTSATMKIKTPKRVNDQLVESGINIEYEENDLQNDTKTEVTINKLGERDTIITITVKAEDGVTEQIYKITIKRPFATIKGEIYTSPTDYLNKFTSDIRLFDSTEVRYLIDWNTISDMKDVHTDLSGLDSINYTTENDGKYEIYVIPKTYDILLDKPGYLDHLYKQRTLAEGDVLDLGKYELLAGDLNKDGVINLTDIATLSSQYLVDDSSADYIQYYYFDFNEDKVINLTDIATLSANYLKNIEVE